MRLILSLSLILFCFNAYPAELSIDNFSFQLPGEWQISANKHGTKTAQKNNVLEHRAFIISIYHPQDIAAGSKMLLAWQDILIDQGKKDKRLKLDKSFKGYRTIQGAPFKYIAFRVEKDGGSYIGASLGSNHGVILITYEGNIDLHGAIKELNSILETMKYNGS